jgi:hypothetical protein
MLARALLIFTLLAGALLATARPALADSTVVVLGIRSVEGDDDVANDATEQLRGAARAVQGWTISNAAVSMAQMTLAHGCDEVDAACLAEIAKGLQADLLIYGTMRRTSAREDYDYALNLNLFENASGQITRSVDDTIPRAQVDFQSLAARADKLIARLSSTSTGGAIEIQANIEDAEVQVNGQVVGTTRQGALRLEGLQAGKYRIEIRKRGYAPHVSTVTVAEGLDTSIAAVLSAEGTAGPAGATEPQPASHGHHLQWLGWSLIGLGGASLIGLGVSLAVIEGVNRDALYGRYRDAVAQGNEKVKAEGMPEDVVKDVCYAAKQGFNYNLSNEETSEVAHKCSTADTFEVLQWVFLSTAIVSGGVGAYLVLSGDHGGHAQDHDYEHGQNARPSFSLHPSFSPRAAALNAMLRF